MFEDSKTALLDAASATCRARTSTQMTVTMTCFSVLAPLLLADKPVSLSDAEKPIINIRVK